MLGRSIGGGGGEYLFVACLGHLSIDQEHERVAMGK